MRIPIAVALVVAGVCGAASATGQQTSEIQFTDGKFSVKIPQSIAAPADGWGSIFRVYAGGATDQPIIGSYIRDEGAVVFRPRYPALPTMSYRVVFEAVGGQAFSSVFGPAAARAPSAKVLEVYPSGDVLPSNILKLYLVFSEPMSRGEVWKRLHLLDESGVPVPLAFLEIEQELWDPTGRRLTVLFDPGRIKRGLVPQTEMGTPIIEGKRYTLKIDREWRDAQGGPMAQGFTREFRGGPVDRTSPAPSSWRLIAPESDGRSALTVEFPKAMDFALMQRMVEVQDANGRRVAGSVSTGKHERQWIFVPSRPWDVGNYKVIASPDLEDTCGNRVYRAFDVDTKGDKAVKIPAAVEIPFTIR